MIFEVLGKPQGKQRARVTMRGNYARAYTPDETLNYENLIAFSFKCVAGNGVPELWDKPVVVDITAQYGCPKAFSKKKREAALIGEFLPRVKPDADNVVKVVCDALNGVAYRDDTQVVEIHVKKIYSEVPKLVVKLEEYKS